MGFGVPSSSNATTILNPNDVATSILNTGVKQVDKAAISTSSQVGPIAVGTSTTIINGLDVSAYQSFVLQLFCSRVVEITLSWETGVTKVWESWAMATFGSDLIYIVDNHYGASFGVTLKNIDSTSAPQDLYGWTISQSNRVLPGEIVINKKATCPNGGLDNYLANDSAPSLAAGATGPLVTCGLTSGAISYEFSTDKNAQLLFQWGINGFHHAVALSAGGFANGVLYGPRRPFIYQFKNVDTTAGTPRINLHQAPRIY